MTRILATILTLLSLTQFAHAEGKGSHGMLVFGEQTTYLSHLPMFHPPHDRQLLLAVSFQDIPAGSTLARYRDSKQQGAEFFTLLPEPLVLSALAAGEIGSFQADLYLGHFERGGTNLGPVAVQVSSVLFTAPLQPDPPTGAPDDYLFFGSNGEYYALHLIKQRPSFDTVLAMSPLIFTREGHCPSRLCGSTVTTPVSDKSLPVIISNTGGSAEPPTAGTVLGNGTSANSTVRKVLYLETQDLSD